MVKRLFVSISLILMLSFLSGCEQLLGDLLDVVTKYFSEDSEENGDINTNEEPINEPDNELNDVIASQNDDENDAEGDDVEKENTEEQQPEEQPSIGIVTNFIPVVEFIPYLGEAAVPIDDRLRNQGYDIYRPVHGMPLPIPYQWLLVDGESKPGEFFGLYCFDIPQDVSIFANHFDHYYLDQDVKHDLNPSDDSLIHVTTLNVNRNNTVFEASIKYGLDQHENTCATVDIRYGNDSDIGIGALELAAKLDQSRQRTLPNNYDEILQQASSESNFYRHSSPNLVKEAIYEEQAAMLPWLEREVPDIFLFDSYLIRSTHLDNSSEWDGLMCTDIPINIAVDKHLELLGNYNADIHHFEVVDPDDNTSMLRVAVIIDFAFNDEYGTGSWSGSSYFYRYENDDTPFSEQRCMVTDLQFSAELID